MATADLRNHIRSVASEVRVLARSHFKKAAQTFATHPNANNYRRLERFARIHQHAGLNMENLELARIHAAGSNEVEILCGIEEAMNATRSRVGPVPPPLNPRLAEDLAD